MNKMEKQLLEEIKTCIKENIPDKKIGVAFSGGVDSTLISKICSDMGYDITLLTIGFPASHDILFAKEVNHHLKFSHNILEIESDTFQTISKKVKQTIKTDNLSWNENCIAFFYVSQLAKSLGINIVVTANGIDELFCGYNAYREAISKGEFSVLEVMNSKLDNEIKMMKAVNQIASEFNVRIIQPLLSPTFIEFAKTIPISEKIHNSEDVLRKHIIRKLASDVGVPEISYTKRKKALQYGSKIHKALLNLK